MSSAILVLNCGSSSIKFEVRAIVERQTGGRPPQAIVHRVVVRRVVREIGAHAAIISSAHSRVLVAVEPTNEEWVAASHAQRVLAAEKAHAPQP